MADKAMTHILLMECNTRERNTLVAKKGVPSGSEIYIAAIRAHFPEIGIDVIHAADRGESLPEGRSFSDYDGLVIGGSSLHAYDTSFEVTNQIDFVRAFAETGTPILGSCWGLQIAVMAAGGNVETSSNGREIGFARKVEKTKAGRAHPFLAGKPDVYDAPCIHYDEITKLPMGATVLAGNAHSPIQVAAFNLGASDVWAVQYHPEFDLAHVNNLLSLSKQNLFEQGVFENQVNLAHYQHLLNGLAENPKNQALAWQLGVDSDITDDKVRCAEIINWVGQL